MAYSRYLSASFGTSKAAVATVGYQLFDTAGAVSGSRITAGVQNLGDGAFGALVTIPDLFQGRITWDTGEVTPGKASEGVNPPEPALLAAITALAALPAAAVVNPTLTGADLTLLRGETLSIPITGLGNITGRSKMWFTLKARSNPADDKAIVQILETGGLVRLNGAAGTAGDGSLTVTDQATGAAAVLLKPAASVLLPVGDDMLWDVQVLTSGVIRTPIRGSAAVVGDVTQAVS